MPSLPKYPDIKETDRAYFAGLFDGEGTVAIYKHIRGTQISYSFDVSFGISYESVLIRMQKCFGGNIYKKNMEKLKNCLSIKKLIAINYYSPDKRKQIYHYILSGRDALYFLKVIEPFCDEKKQQVSLGIRYEQGKRESRNGRSKHETERCEFFYQELRRLKKEQPSNDELENETDFEDEQQDIFSFVSEE